jgi:tight adherence protein C
MTVDAPFGDRVVIPVFGALAKFVVELLPSAFVSRVSRQLVAAGGPVTTSGFFVVVILLGIFFPAALMALAVMLTGSLSPFLLLVTLFVAGVGLFLPFLWLRRSVRRRKEAIWKSLPDAFDLITVAVEAGLGLDAALRQVAEKLRGPLAEEIGRMLREVGMGRPRREALEDMAERVDVKELKTFVNAIIQAETLGTSLGRVLRAQGLSMRIQRRQRAEELARKAPVKMVFPLVLFIMPTFFLVTLGPVGIRLLNYLNE